MNINIKPISNFASGIINKVRNKINDRKRAQENFKNRKDNTNYYQGSGYWKDHTN